MEKWVLTVGYDKERFNEAQRESLQYGIFIRMASDSSEAIALLSKNNSFLLVIIFSDGPDYLNPLKTIRSLTKAPILMLRHRYDGAEKIAAIAAGADEYIQWPDTIQEGVASCRALIRRYTELNRRVEKQNILLCNSVFISLDYRKVFVNALEIELPRREFDLFYILSSAPDRVFTYEQLSKKCGAAIMSPRKTVSIPASTVSAKNWKAYREQPAVSRIFAVSGTASNKKKHDSCQNGLTLVVKPFFASQLAIFANLLPDSCQTAARILLYNPLCYGKTGECGKCDS